MKQPKNGYLMRFLPGGPSGTRTPDQPVMSRQLWPTELMALTRKSTSLKKCFSVAPQVGLEPTTLRLTVACSTGWAIEECLSWRLPIVPGRYQPSIFGTDELNFCVRNGNRWTLVVINTNYIWKAGINCSSFQMVTRAGIEPTLTAWEAAVLTAWPTGHRGISLQRPEIVSWPLSDFSMVHHQGLEPGTPWLRVRINLH